MVAKIKSGKSLIGAINYNENKVKAGKAILLAAQLYSKDVELLSFNDKLFRLTDLANRNQRTKTNSVHLSLNFDLSEDMNAQTLVDISDSYMDKIGFGNQPYLVYQHTDAGHPHVHIVTTNIDAEGGRISLHNIGRLKSEPARKQVEKEFGLIEAESKSIVNKQIERDHISPLVYGEFDVKRAITNIVNAVVQQYKFSSLPEFNAILRLYNIEADPGNRESVMFKKGGLRYWALDVSGKKLGVPIKASAVYGKPTQYLLNDRYKLGEYLRKPFKESLKNTISQALAKSLNKNQFLIELKQQEVVGVLRHNADGRVYGVTYIDFRNKSVFNGSDLGKSFSAAAIMSALQTNAEFATARHGKIIEPENTLTVHKDFSRYTNSNSLLDDLLMPTYQNGNENLFERKKKKKKRKLNL
ncbi:relaxase/mobilization nuclease domain-containing protein [Mucilaginibacter aquariorum]|uniref:Relaxase/mobilization nuclease domain-containing protein n=1 Tax=Mucilaginibacter aquariorum TaxID=2967225 RepID=A0ABT1T104_9SPHI|nr:relaxase/mobilization nuclease domain-containing protein [Mucilaginibacter aquariorum]MCQ6958274.1 relaxase/mobilization nuclease domain-containing protein [Mucilaginibacter aquariorum]